MSNSRGSSALGLRSLGGGGGILGSLGGVVTALGLHVFAFLVGGIFLLGGIGGWWTANMKTAYDSEMNPPATSSDTLDGDLMQMINSKNAVLVGVAIERVLKENSKGSLNVIDRSNPVMQVVINKLKQQGGGSIPDEPDFDPMQCAYFIHATFLVAGVDLPGQPTAHEYWTNRAPYESRGWNYIPNGTGMPSPGDLVVLAGPNPAGHIAMVAGVDPPQGGKNGYVYMVQANAPNNYTKNAADHLTFMRWSINSSGLMQSGWSSYTIEGFIHNQALSQKWGDPFHASSDGSDIRAKIVAAARSRLGDKEWGNNCNHYGPCEEWCALFATWTWRQAGIDYSTAYVPDFMDYGRKHGTLHQGLSNPQPGDAIIFSTGEGPHGHVGIIVEVKPDGKVISIEGNSSNKVSQIGPYSLHGGRDTTAIVSPDIPAGSSGGAKCDKNAPPLSDAQARALAAQAGFTGHSLLVVVAIAHAESSLNPKACLRNTDTHHTLDRGIMQINNYWHSEVSDACAFDPKCSFEQAYRISSKGTSFHPWATYTSGAYRKFMPNGEA
ncbi:CHAP domain-containing protein [Ktedonobacter robiniae]|uniref:Peptidase C51 domain-containing protein n=1 Tax=Ktedonobacter robiniae TaxID=2778365 RepID=A0ABQ3UX28_9CHLR|nr:CHAP domain-containing protein [Ktedonobacter robiniae]GHO57217.1 hypothetical protein KSB_56920 [Ktedonobacter robiniae]